MQKKTKKPIFAQSNEGELWVMLLEKAWAKINGSYSNTKGGLSSDVMFCLTNFPVQYVQHDKSTKEPLPFCKLFVREIQLK